MDRAEETITVHVKLFANLRDRFPDQAIGESMPVKLSAGATLANLFQRLDLPPTKLSLVNGVAQKEAFVLTDQDEVAIIPPVGGG